MDKILLTGATGYIGSNLTKRLLKENKRVYIVARKSSKFDLLKDVMDKINIFIYDGKINNLINYFKRVKPDAVCHLASFFVSEHKSENTDELIDSNIKFGTEVLEAMSKSGVKNLINTGTSWQHYDNKDYNPVCLYAATKEAFEKIIEYYVQVDNFKVITLKLFDTYGPNDNRPKILNLLSKYSKDKTVLKMSGGEQILDLSYIDDIAEAFYHALCMIEKCDMNEHKTYGIYALKRYKLRDIISTYENVTNKKILVEWGARPYRKREIMNPCTCIEKLPGWKPKISLEDGIRLMNSLNKVI